MSDQTFSKIAEELTALSPVLDALRNGLGDDLVAVVLFGSQARGEADPQSDWDLLAYPFQASGHVFLTVE